MQNPDLHPAWYVLHTKSRFENVVFEVLRKKSLDVFLPKIKVRSKRRDRKQMIGIPLFPGYVFVKSSLHPAEHLEIVKTSGAVRLVGNADGPIPVVDETVDSLKIMVAGNEEIKTGARFRKGDRVMVVRGPFAGVSGVFYRYRGTSRVVVHIEALGQYAAVVVDEADLDRTPGILL